MKTIDLTEAVPATIARLRERGESASFNEVLTELGIALVTAPGQRTAAGRCRPPGSEEAATLAWEGPVGAAPDATVSLGRFQLLGELGAGGMGRVLEARDPQLQRSVAVKVVIDPRRVTKTQLARFVAEARITSQLEHPNIVPVHEVGVTPQGEVFFVMKKVEGRSLGQLLASLDAGEDDTAEWTRTRLLHVFIQVCNAVAYAHDRGVLHRDLKPANIMLGAFGEVLVMDWGVARLMGDAAERSQPDRVQAGTGLQPTLSGVTIGTPGYMSPEQASGNLVMMDGRSDVWSLGAILYELLTLERAYLGANALNAMFLAIQGPPDDPRHRAPDRAIPDEIAAVCMRALAAAPADRYATASDLAGAVEAFVEGSRRREAAGAHVADAEAAWERYRALGAERQELEQRVRALEERVPLWAPLEDKAELTAATQRLEGIDPDRVHWFTELLAACDRAFSHDPDHAPARALLARVHYRRLEEAEGQRDATGVLFHGRRVRQFDDGGRYAERLAGTGALSLSTDPDGAEVFCARYDTSAPHVWPLVEERSLGHTPLRAVPLEQGSYLLTIRAPGRRDTRLPVFIPRGHHHDAGPPIPLLTDAAIGAGMVYVPAGVFIEGGDADAQEPRPRGTPWVDGFLASALPVTMGDWCGYINALAEEDPDQAWARVPRAEAGNGGQFWVRPGPGEPFVLPSVDHQGDPWDPRWPVSAVSWDDAVAYAEWIRERDGLPWALPTERQWEKAARGVDGRAHPWGDRFDPTLTKTRHSRSGRPQPEPVGAFGADVSPYGVRDCAGGMRSWCGDLTYGGDPSRRPVRGGAWIAGLRNARLASRSGIIPFSVFTSLGFRLIRPLPE